MLKSMMLHNIDNQESVFSTVYMQIVVLNIHQYPHKRQVVTQLSRRKMTDTDICSLDPVGVQMVYILRKNVWKFCNDLLDIVPKWQISSKNHIVFFNFPLKIDCCYKQISFSFGNFRISNNHFCRVHCVVQFKCARKPSKMIYVLPNQKASKEKQITLHDTPIQCCIPLRIVPISK